MGALGCLTVPTVLLESIGYRFKFHSHGGSRRFESCCAHHRILDLRVVSPKNLIDPVPQTTTALFLACLPPREARCKPHCRSDEFLPCGRRIWPAHSISRLRRYT